MKTQPQFSKKKPTPIYPTYPDVSVKLVGTDGNVYAIIGTVVGALKRAGHTEGAAEFQASAFACESYDKVIRLCLLTVEVR